MTRDERSEEIETELERRILHGLSAEWELATWGLPPLLRRRVRPPVFRLREMTRTLGSWTPHTREISMSRSFVWDHSWDSVREVLRHEMAHQVAQEVMGGGNEPPHGPIFREACRLLGADPAASETLPPLDERIAGGEDADDRVLVKVRKLLALAESANRHEAEAAMLKAHQLMKQYNVDLIESRRPRDYVSCFVGKPALRHFRETYALADLLLSFYFVQGIWVPVYVLEKGKTGRVLEISGTLKNVQIAGYVHDFILGVIDREWRAYNRKRGLTRYRKTDFAVGIIEGFRSKLAADRGGESGAGNARDLVPVKDPKLDDYMAARYPHVRRVSKNAISMDPSVYDDGQRIGKRLVISKGITETGESDGIKRLN